VKECFIFFLPSSLLPITEGKSRCHGRFVEAMADIPGMDAVLAASDSGYRVSLGAHVHDVSYYWRAPDSVDGKGLYYLDAGIGVK
jgi:hypothetical protein